MVLMVIRILNTCVPGFLCCVYGLISASSWFFLWFLICRLVHFLILGLVGNFYFFNSHFLVTTLGLELLSGANLNKFCLSVAQ